MAVDEVIFLLLNLQKINVDKYFCFRFGTKVFISCLQIWKGSVDSKNTKRKSREEVKKLSLDSMIIDEILEFHDLKKKQKRYKTRKKQRK